MSETTSGPTLAKRRVPIPIRVKLLASLVVPLVTVAVMCYLQVSQARDHVRDVEEETALASVLLQPGGLVDALITEQGDATVTLLGLRDTAPIPTESFDASMTETDAAVEDFAAALESGGPLAEELFGSTLVDIESTLAELRGEFDRIQAESEGSSPLVNLVPVLQDLYPRYSEIIEDVIAANERIATVISDPGMRSAAQSLTAVNLINFNTSRLTSAVGTSILQPGNEGRDPVVRYLSEFERSLSLVPLSVEDGWREEAQAVIDNEAFVQMVARARDFLETGEINIEEYIQLNPAGETRETSPMGSPQRLAQATNSALTRMIDDQLADARAEQQRYTILAIAVLILATGTALLVARSILRPMRELTDQAEAMATTTLPAAVSSVLETPPDQDVVIPELDPISISSRDELQTVAEAINHVQSSALSLAVEQATLRRNIADSFVSLGRRTQNLIGLQLEQITRLEQDETDPAVLDSLYRLDHLATRARRNAESLVVLGGTSSAPSGGAPVAMSDVVRATLSEVDAYQRVDITHVDDAFVSGSVAADVIHLLAELVENGLSFSPPDTDVLVEGRQDPAGYRITVVDSGVGMSAERLEQANRRLADNESFTVAPSRYLGHYVAGKLASRVGAQVSLANGASKGVVATVVLPPSALVSEVPASRPAQAATAAASPSDDGFPQPQADAPAARGEGVRVDGRPPVVAGALQSAPTGQPAPTTPVPTAPAAEAPRPAAPPAAAAQAPTGTPAPHPQPVPAPAGSTEPPPGELTSAGLRKRTPGVHAKAVRERSPLLRSAAARASEQAPLAAEPTPQAVANMASLLSDYTSGLERGRGDLTGQPTNNTEHSE